MEKDEALSILRSVQGRQYQYIKDWGFSLVRMAITTLRNRNITEAEWDLLYEIETKIARKY